MGRTIRQGIGLAIAVAVASWAARPAPAQYSEPGPFPVTNLPTTPGNADPLPPLTFDDPDVQPAQFTMAAGTAAVSRGVLDPPPPVVRIQVRVPADSPPGDDLKYQITVQNTATVDAHAVSVRVPLPETVEGVVKAEPEYDKTQSTTKQLVWSFGTLGPGKSKVIELTLRPRKEAAEVKCLAYVKFEHGQVVTTRLNKPGVKVTKFAPKQTVRDEPFTVRIAVDNTGKVPAENVRIAENVPASAEVQPITKGAKRTTQPEGQQWVWEIARLLPGERKVLEYQVIPREAKDVITLTNLSGAKGVAATADARTTVLVPGLTIKLTGPPGIVNPGEPARYELTVRNTGTLPSTGLKVTGTLPADCKPVMKTEGGQLTRDAITWTLPRLDPGEAHTFRFAVKATTTGRRLVVATVADARGQRAADELATVFQGTAALVWETVPNPAALAVGRQGTFTVKVRNTGGEAARNVRLEIDLPDSVSLVRTTPTVRPTGAKVAFGPETIPASGEAIYTITYEAKQAAQAWFKLTMTADALGDRPMQTEKAVEITGSR
jgi:uncharacterized repeat protein (TIGR01451 family)